VGFHRSNGVWTQQGSKLVGMDAAGTNVQQGISVALSADGNTAMVGGPFDNRDSSSNAIGAAWVFVQPPPLQLQVNPTTNIVASGIQGGPFSPSSFSYTLSVASGRVSYSISNVPNWLTPSSTSGTASSSGTTVTFRVNPNANSLTPNTYVNSINFNNTTNGQGNTTRVATLMVNAPSGGSSSSQQQVSSQQQSSSQQQRSSQRQQSISRSRTNSSGISSGGTTSSTSTSR
jgi:hypothetical protein